MFVCICFVLYFLWGSILCTWFEKGYIYTRRVFKISICLHQSLTVLMWPTAVDRTLSKIKLLTNKPHTQRVGIWLQPSNVLGTHVRWAKQLRHSPQSRFAYESVSPALFPHARVVKTLQNSSLFSLFFPPLFFFFLGSGKSLVLPTIQRAWRRKQ